MYVGLDASAHFCINGGNPKCQGQAFLLSVLCAENSVSRACLCTARKRSACLQILSKMAFGVCSEVVNLYYNNIVRMQCFARRMFSNICIVLSLELSRQMGVQSGGAEYLLRSADGACRRSVSFLRMMHHCIMASGFRRQVPAANRRKSRCHRDWHCD